MGQCGDIRAVGMRALQRLIELLRIAKQHDVGRGVGDRQQVGQRQLGGFVDEEHVDAVIGLGPRPKPGGAGGEIAAGVQRFEDRRIGFGQLDAQVGVVGLGTGADLADRAQLNARLIGGLKCAVQQVADYAMAVGGEADPPPLFDHFDDHPPRGVGFAGAGRPLNREEAEVIFANDAAGRSKCIFSRTAKGLAAGARRTA